MQKLKSHPTFGLTTQGYHAHIYFTAETRVSAFQLQQGLEKLGIPLLYMGKLIDKPVGPHPIPMFEINFTPERLPLVMAFLELHHGPHSVLIHSVSGNDHTDHSDGALWLGKKLNLDFSKLDPPPASVKNVEPV